MNEPDLIIVGAGGFGRETAQAALAGAYPGSVLGFLDDARSADDRVVGLPILGPLERIREFPAARLVVTVGRPDQYTTRHQIVRRLDLPDDRFAKVVHPGCSLAADTLIGPGTIILAGVIATAGVVIGKHVAVMPATVLTHECEVADFATLATGVQLAGGVSVGRGAYLGAGTQVRQGLSIGPWAMTGMGAMVLREVPERRLVYGAPAKDQGRSSAAQYDDS